MRYLMLAAVTVLAGCGDSGTEPATASVHGVWRVTVGPIAGSGATCGSDNFGMALEQTGTTFVGSAETIPFACSTPNGLTRHLLRDPIVTEGTIDGRTIAFNFSDPAFHQVGQVGETTMSGTAQWTLDLGMGTPVTVVGKWSAYRAPI